MTLSASAGGVTGPVAVVEVEHHRLHPRLQCWLDADAICAMLQQACAQDLRVGVIEQWLAAYKRGEYDDTLEGNPQ